MPTVELRVCDACPIVDDAVLIAGLFRALVAEAIAADDARRVPARPAGPRAPGGDVACGPQWAQPARCSPRTPTRSPNRPPTWCARSWNALAEHLEETGDRDEVEELTGALLARGDSATRQRARFAERGRVSDVVALVVAETQGRIAFALDTPEITAGYPDAPDDEALALSGIPYPAYRPVFDVLDEFGPAELGKRVEVLRENALSDGLTFGIGGEQRPFPVDLVPRIIPAHEWHTLAAGLTQRARAIELFLRDIYGPARIVEDGLLDWETVHATPGLEPRPPRRCRRVSSTPR